MIYTDSRAADIARRAARARETAAALPRVSAHIAASAAATGQTMRIAAWNAYCDSSAPADKSAAYEIYSDICDREEIAARNAETAAAN